MKSSIFTTLLKQYITPRLTIKNHITQLQGKTSLVVFLLLAILISSSSFLPSYILAKSPFFSRQEIRDASVINNAGKSTIQAVSYESDGQFLDATIWFSSAKKQLFGMGGSYGILIDSDRSQDTGLYGNQTLPFASKDVSISGADYLIAVLSPNGTKWTRTIGELSSTGNTKVIDILNKYPSPNTNSSANNYANLTLDLRELYFPTHYVIKFFTGNNNLTKLTDATDWLSVPSPIVQMTAYPGSVTVEPGKNNSIQIQSKSDVDPQPQLASCLRPSGLSGLTFLNSPNQTIDSDQSIPSPLKIHAADNLSEGTYFVKVFADVHRVNNTNLNPNQICALHEQHTHALPTVFQVIIHKFTFSDAFHATVGDFFQKNGSAIILAAITALIAAVIGLVIKRISGSSKQKLDKESD